jgi:hypothetical protein
MASARSGLGPERPREPRADQGHPHAGKPPDLKPAVAADVDLREAGEVPLAAVFFARSPAAVE